MPEKNEDIEIWCNRVAALGVDVLLDCKLIKEEDVKQAIDIVAEEILVRFSIGDCPPPIK